MYNHQIYSIQVIKNISRNRLHVTGVSSDVFRAFKG